MKYAEEILRKSLGFASRDGVVIFGFVLKPEDNSVSAFSSQNGKRDDFIFNIKAALKHLEAESGTVSTDA